MKQTLSTTQAASLLKTKNTFACCAIVSKYKGPTDFHGSRIIVKSDRGRKVYPYPHELSDEARHVYCVTQYLADILKKDRAEYGEHSNGWGEISEYSVGIIPSGEYVFVRN